MLSQDDRHRLADIERQLWHDDPGFAARMAEPDDDVPDPCSPLLPCCLIWLVIPVLAVAGRWSGAVAVSVIAVVTTVTLLRLSRRRAHRGDPGNPSAR